MHPRSRRLHPLRLPIYVFKIRDFYYFRYLWPKDIALRLNKMDFLTDLKRNYNQGFKHQTLVLVNNLCGFTIFPILRESLRLWPVKIFFFRATKTGLKMRFGLKYFRLFRTTLSKSKTCT